MVKNLFASADVGLSPWSGGGNGNPLQCSCLGSHMDRGAGCSPWPLSMGFQESDRT